MEIDWNVVRSRFAGMTREQLLEEAALRVDDYAPLAQRLLAGEALARGITAAEIEEKKRGAAAPTLETDGIELPALITSSDEKSHLQELAKGLRERGIPAVLRELDPKTFHASGHRVGRWGLMVAGRQAAAAAALLEPVIPEAADETVAAGCGGGCCAGPGECDPAGDEWPEDGDWWKTSPGDDEPHEGQR